MKFISYLFTFILGISLIIGGFYAYHIDQTQATPSVNGFLQYQQDLPTAVAELEIANASVIELNAELETKTTDLADQTALLLTAYADLANAVTQEDYQTLFDQAVATQADFNDLVILQNALMLEYYAVIAERDALQTQIDELLNQPIDTLSVYANDINNINVLNTIGDFDPTQAQEMVVELHLTFDATSATGIAELNISSNIQETQTSFIVMYFDILDEQLANDLLSQNMGVLLPIYEEFIINQITDQANSIIFDYNGVLAEYTLSQLIQTSILDEHLATFDPTQDTMLWGNTIAIQEPLFDLENVIIYFNHSIVVNY